LYNALNYEWSQAYNNTSVYAAVDSLNAALLYAEDKCVSRGSIRKTEYLSWFSDCVIYWIYKNDFRRRFRHKNAYYFHSFQNIVNLSKLPSNPTGLPG